MTMQSLIKLAKQQQLLKLINKTLVQVTFSVFTANKLYYILENW